MQKITAIAIILFTTFGAFAQKGTTSLGFTFSGDYTKVWRTGGDVYYKQFCENIDGKLGFTAGINASFQRREKGAFDIGLLYMANKEGYNLGTTYYRGFATYLTSGEVALKRHFVSIPLNWLFTLTKERRDFMVP